MNIVEVIPFAPSAPGLSPTLSYFTAKEVSAGDVVTVPLRGKSVVGMVASVREAAEEKAVLRSSSFRLRKLSNVLGESLFSDAYVKTAQALAEFYVSSVGEIIEQAAPRVLFERYREFEAGQGKKGASKLKEERFVFQREFDERVDSYKTLIRTEFARGASLFIILPTALEVEHFASLLSRGIEPYTYVFHGGVTKKEVLKRYNKMARDKHPVLILATPSYLFIDRPELNTLILEHESSNAYRSRSRPHLDFRVFAETLSGFSGKKLILADTFLQLETLYRAEKREFLEFAPLKWRLPARASTHAGGPRKEGCSLVDTREREGDFTLISNEARSAIADAVGRRGAVFVYAVRKGLHPLTVCNDCGTTLSCTRCAAPYVLHGSSDEGRVFICHKCKNERAADLPCEECGGWRLTALGYGTESVAAELTAAFPEAEVKIFDKDHVTTPARAKTLAHWFEERPPARAGTRAGGPQEGRILVGTDLALHYLSEPADTIVVASIDSLSSIPSFRISERIFRALADLRERSRVAFLVQTRLRDQKLLERVLGGDLLNFYRDEITARLEYRYPPAVRLIKITIEGKQSAVKEERDAVAGLLAAYAPESYSAFISKVKGLYRGHLVLRLPLREWAVTEPPESFVDRRLLGILRSLPPSFTVRIDPEDLL